MRTWLWLERGGPVLLLALGLLLMAEVSTFGQEGPQPEAQDGSSVFALPEWAEPRESASEDATPAPRRPEAFRTNDDTPTPPPIPIGGLEWLILAGAGYGLWKLRATGGATSTDP